MSSREGGSELPDAQPADAGDTENGENWALMGDSAG
jgi:hypothetical protein